MTVLCKVFGHKLPKGYGRDRPYLEQEFYTTDGINRHHVKLYARCARCDKKYHVAYIHHVTLDELTAPTWNMRRD